jgi:hypothetical protein
MMEYCNIPQTAYAQTNTAILGVIITKTQLKTLREFFIINIQDII